MLRGAISYWSERGFGFITRDDGGPDVFVHSTALPAGIKQLDRGQGVAFDIELGRKGKVCATNVAIV